MDLSAAFAQYWNEMQAGILPGAVKVIVEISPLVLAFIMFQICWSVWVRYVRAKNFLSIKYALFELRLPKETFKSPLAMEVFLNSLHNTAQGNFYGQYWRGETRPWYSLEIASVEGQVKFYIWTEDRRKKMLAALYAIPGDGSPRSRGLCQVSAFRPQDHEGLRLRDSSSPRMTRIRSRPTSTTASTRIPRKSSRSIRSSRSSNGSARSAPTSRAGYRSSSRPIRTISASPAISSSARISGRTGLRSSSDEDPSPRPEDQDPGASSEKNPAGTFLAVTKGEQDVVAALERAISKQSFDVGIRASISRRERPSTPRTASAASSRASSISRPST
jgi:hypothetical protein